MLLPYLRPERWREYSIILKPIHEGLMVLLFHTRSKDSHFASGNIGYELLSHIEKKIQLP